MADPAQIPAIFANADVNTSSVDMNSNFSYLVNYINTNCSDLGATVKFTGLPSGPDSLPSGVTQLSNKKFADKRGFWRAATEQTKTTIWNFGTTQQTVATFTRTPPYTTGMAFEILISGYINPGPQSGKWVGLLDMTFGGSVQPTVRFAGSGNSAGSWREFNYSGFHWTATASPAFPLSFVFKTTAFSGVSAGQVGQINCNVIITSYLTDLTTVT